MQQQQIQPFKNLMVEEQNQGQVQQVQDVSQKQYINLPQSNALTLEQSNNRSLQQLHSQDQGTSKHPQVINIEHYEQPMKLNAWSLTDFHIDNHIEAELLAHIKQLKFDIDINNEIIQELENKEKPEKVIPHKEPVPVDNSRELKIELENAFVEHDYAQNTELPPKQTTTKKLEGPLVSIGPNGTKVPANEYEKISWTSSSIATRKLLGCIFDRETLASHSMTGKPSPAFKDMNKPVKSKLDSKAIEDIIFVVTNNCGVSAKEVRSAITTKCADENKMVKMKALKNMKAKRRSMLTALKSKTN